MLSIRLNILTLRAFRFLFISREHVDIGADSSGCSRQRAERVGPQGAVVGYVDVSTSDSTANYSRQVIQLIGIRRLCGQNKYGCSSGASHDSAGRSDGGRGVDLDATRDAGYIHRERA
jgi:hypothetical protein